MKVARLHGVGDLRLHSESVPEPAEEEEVLVRVGAVGICGSDLHWFGEGHIGDARLGRPLVLGHEFAGTVEGGRLSGRAVAVDPAIPCGACATCARGLGHLCATVRFAGHGELDGGLRELLAWPTRLLHPLPDGLTVEDGAMLEPLGVAIHAVDLGIPDDDRTTFPASAARRKGLTLLISRRMGDVYPRAIELAVRQHVDIRSIVSHRYALDEVTEAFGTASERSSLKVLVLPAAAREPLAADDDQ